MIRKMFRKWLLVTLASVSCFSFAQEEEIDPLTWRQIKNLEIEAETDGELAFQLGYAYLQGSSGLPKKLQKGERILKELSERYPVDENVAKAAFILGKLYLGAEEHLVDEEVALDYFRLASRFAKGTGLEEAPYQVASLLKDDEEYIKYMEMAGNAGFMPAMLQLFIAYIEGDRVKVNDKAAIAWLRKAAQAGHVEAQAELGTYFFNGQYTYQDYERAYYWTVRAAEQNHPGAQTRLGLMYKLGLGRPLDTGKAKLWFERSHSHGHNLGTENLATLLLNTEDKEKQAEGANLMIQAAENGAKSAAQQLVKLYEQGIGVDKDPQQAEYWQQKAFDMLEEEGAQLIGTNSFARSDKKAYKIPVEAVNAYNTGIDYVEKEEYQTALSHLQIAAMARYPAAQLDLAWVLIKIAEKQDDNALYEQAFAWAKLAHDSKQDGAEQLITRLTEAFPTRMVESSLHQYNKLKEQLRDKAHPIEPL